MNVDLMAPLSEAGTAAHCPGCGSGHTTWVSAGGRNNLLCKTCGACWHEAAGRTVRTDPTACAGCPLRAVCDAANGIAAKGVMANALVAA